MPSLPASTIIAAVGAALALIGVALNIVALRLLASLRSSRGGGAGTARPESGPDGTEEELIAVIAAAAAAGHPPESIIDIVKLDGRGGAEIPVWSLAGRLAGRPLPRTP
jgi:hypothetical protein